MLCSSCGLLAAPAAQALRIPEETASGRHVQVHAFWNRDFLCLAAKVPDTIITGTSNQPMSTPEQDDAIEFDFLLSSGEAHRLIISAAEGMTMYTRDPHGNWRSDNAWVRGPHTIKYAVVVNGTLNNPQDTDTDFVVECAIPWEFLGGTPKQGLLPVGFNVVNWMQGENEGLVSWSPYITSAADVGDVTRWGRLLITGSTALLSAQGLDYPCPYSSVGPIRRWHADRRGVAYFLYPHDRQAGPPAPAGPASRPERAGGGCLSGLDGDLPLRLGPGPLLARGRARDRGSAAGRRGSLVQLPSCGMAPESAHGSETRRR